jgi:HAD superfamily hydrolase (TIGR01509 family)
MLDGVENLIISLHKQKKQLILASSSSKVTIDRVFKRFNLHQYFSHIVSGEDFAQSKPNPAIFNEAVRLSASNKENCVIIEDSTNGILAANDANVFCIGYKSKNSKKQNYDTANLVIENFSELNIDFFN